MSEYPSRAIVDLQAISDNVTALAARARSAEVMAVVKGDAYGHGLLPSARASLAGGATWLGVAQISEALELRAAGIDAAILAWLYAPGAPLDRAVEADIDLSVAATWALAEVVAAARLTGKTARVHVKVDTGLGRGGVMPDEFDELLDAALAAQAEGTCRLVGLWSHLAWADAPDHPAVVTQREVFDEAIARSERRGARFEVRHLANSAATLTASAMHYDLVRPGLAVYGLSPVPRLADPADFGLRPAMRVEASLTLVKPVPADHGVSYGHAYVTPAATVLGVVPLGYADGIPRHASGTRYRVGGPVQVGERRLGVAGRVCMDQFVVDLGPDAREAAGDTVVLFGAGSEGEPTAEDWARTVGTISYEIVARLGVRVPREYLGDEALVHGRAAVPDDVVAPEVAEVVETAPPEVVEVPKPRPSKAKKAKAPAAAVPAAVDSEDHA